MLAPKALSSPRRNAALPPLDALRRLKEGNRRFVDEITSMRSRLTATREWRARLAEGQSPFAVIVACSDSRVPAEIIFDQGLGDLFIVRNAGTILDHGALASIEFALAKLGTSLVLVLAHERCGAFLEAYDRLRGEPAPTESLRELVDHLRPAIEGAGSAEDRDACCERACALNARMVAARVARSPIAEPLVRSGDGLVVPACYHLVEGTVEFFEPVAAAAAP